MLDARVHISTAASIDLYLTEHLRFCRTVSRLYLLQQTQILKIGWLTRKLLSCLARLNPIFFTEVFEHIFRKYFQESCAAKVIIAHFTSLWKKFLRTLSLIDCKLDRFKWAKQGSGAAAFWALFVKKAQININDFILFVLVITNHFGISTHHFRGK